MPNKILSYPEAINYALVEKMTRDKSIYVLGQGSNDSESAVGPFKGLKEKFGDRIQDVPMAEESIAGICVGMSMNNLRVINSHIRMDFLLLCLNQIINMAAKIHYMYGGKQSCPVAFRSMIGRSWGQGPQHSQSFYPQFINIPGLNVYAPVIPYDAAASYMQMLEDFNPSIMIEHRLLYYQKGLVDDYDFIKNVPTRVLKEGTDITLVGISQMAIECLRAAKILEKQIGVKAEVIAPISLKPLDTSYIEESVKKTQCLIVVDNSWIECGLGAEIISRLHEKGIHNFMSARMGFAETICPTSPSIEKLFYPDPVSIAKKVCEIFGYKLPDDNPVIEREEIEFKGPF